MERPFVMLTFDLEEFDIPEEYGQKVPQNEQMSVTLAGMQNLLQVLDKYQIKATFFTTGNFAEKNPELIQNLAERHEIASHALFHSPTHEFKDTDIAVSKQILERITSKPVKGFRMPRLRKFDPKTLVTSGFLYDSSINPTWLPGRYNFLNRNAMPEKSNGLIVLPTSTTPLIRIPLFWLAFKNMPLSWYLLLCRWTLKRRRNLMLYFHPWEFADLSTYQLPVYVKAPDNDRLTGKLDKLVMGLKNAGGDFVTCEQFCQQTSLN